MKYTVEWLPAAENDLAEIWGNAGLHVDDVTRAADHIDTVLGYDPLRFSESRLGNRRVMFEFPLMIHFEIIEDDYLVRVISVAFIRGRS